MVKSPKSSSDYGNSWLLVIVIMMEMVFLSVSILNWFTDQCDLDRLISVGNGGSFPTNRRSPAGWRVHVVVVVGECGGNYGMSTGRGNRIFYLGVVGYCWKVRYVTCVLWFTPENYNIFKLVFIFDLFKNIFQSCT